MKYQLTHVGVLASRPAVARDNVPMMPDEIVDQLNAYHDALVEAHRILLHEMDNGRTPTMLQGVGLGYFEDVLSYITHKGTK